MSSHERPSSTSPRAGAKVFVLSVARLGIQLVASVLIARLIGPSSYGVAAFVLLFAAFAELLKESGLAAPIVSERRVTRTQARSATRFGLLVGTGAGLVSMGITSLVGALTGIAPYIGLGPIAALIFPIAGVTGVRTALLIRTFRAPTLGVIELGAVLVSTTVGILLASSGAGALSLVVQALTFAVLVAAGTWSRRPLSALPDDEGGVDPRTQRAGLHVALSQLINNAVGSADRLALGVFAMPTQVGAYAQAYQLFAVPLQFLTSPVQRIAIPEMSANHRNGSAVASIYVGTVRRLTLLLWPLYAVLCVVAPVLIDVLLGNAWAEAGTVLRVLTLAACAQLIGYVTGWMFLATGQSRNQLIWASWSRPLLVLAVIIGLPWGAVGVAWGVSIMSAILVLPGLMFCGKAVHVSVRDLLHATVWPALCAVTSGLLAAATYVSVRALDTSDMVALVAAVLAGGLGAVATVLATPSLRREVMSIWGGVLSRPEPTRSPHRIRSRTSTDTDRPR
jgi:O-antigen/teichoic acid export membrane protein